MIKRLWLYSILLFSCMPAFAQFTSVTATITDLDGQTWNNGKWSVTLYNRYPQSPANINGTPLTTSQLNQSGVMNGSGVFSLTLADNSIVAPSGTYWVFTICPNSSAQCAVVSTPVSGASQNISSILSSGLKGPRFSANIQAGGAWGYLDTEIYPSPNPGGQYYNVTSGCQRVWSGSAWSCLNTGSGFTLSVNGVSVSNPNFANSATVSFTNPSGNVVNASASASAAGCVPTGSAGPFLINNGSGTCTNGPMSYNSGTGALSTTVTTRASNVTGTDTQTAGSFSFSTAGTLVASASGMSYISNAGASVTDTSSNNINIHELGTSSINITADLAAVNLNGTSVNANGFSVCTQATGCPSSSNGTDYYWTFTTCSNNLGQPSQCLGTAFLPGNMPDANYSLQCSVNSSGVSNQLLIVKQYPLPTSAGSSISYAMVQVMQNGTGGGLTFNAYCHAHHD